MGGADVRSQGAGLIGRESECAEVDRLLARAAAGESAVLVIRGEAGIGKSALLDYAAERAGDFLVLRADGFEAEADLAFAGLYGLLRPVLHHLDQLPERHAAALAGGLGIAPSADADRLLVAAALLGLLAAAGEQQPVVCLIDDAQWLDKASRDALVFAARRLAAERVAMLFGIRDGEGRRFAIPGVAEVALTGVNAEAAQRILSVGAERATAVVRQRMLTEADGNPLALIELPGGLTDAQLRGEAALPDAIPLTPRLQDVFRQRISQLPESAQAALLIAAADDTGDLPTVIRAAFAAGLPGDALDAAETAGLIRITRDAIHFRHPLVRSAIQERATLSQRQRAHESLAHALIGEQHADRRVWHQAMATLAPDEEVAAALEASGRRSRTRSAHASAATALLRAAELSTDEQRRVRRLAAAASAAWDAGQGDRARRAIASAMPGAGRVLRAQLLYLSGIIEAHAGSVREAPALLLEAAELTEDGLVKREILQEAGEAAAYSGDMELVRQVSSQEGNLPVLSERDHFLWSVQMGWVAAFEGDHRKATVAFTDALSRAAEIDDPRALIWAADSASAGFGIGSGLPYATRAVELARERALLSLLPMALHRQTLELIWNSRFDLAYAVAEEGYRLAVDLGYGTGVHLANLAIVEAVRGLDERARGHAVEAQAIGQRSGSNLLADTAESTLGFIELAAGRHEEATARLLALTNLDRPAAHPVIAMQAVPDLVEAAVKAGREAETGTALERYRAWDSATSTSSGAALLARCDALLGRRPGDDGFDEAIARAGALPPFQRARTELLYGEWLRRERRRQDARVHLRSALEQFAALGTHPWERRAEAELRATGETTRRRDPSTLDELTPQELQIAGLVSEGLTNREIATQLFLSPRTIDYHLRKVFSKLGITSRTELVRRGTLSRERR